jgi:hypothetical protein
MPRRTRALSVTYRSLLPDGKVWCESRDPSDFMPPDGPGFVGPVLNGQPVPLTMERCVTYEVVGSWSTWEFAQLHNAKMRSEL